MLTLHHLENSRSQRILWMLEELEIDYTLTIYKRDPQTNLAPDGLRQIHPLGKSPVIEDDGSVIAETGAMIEHIIDWYGAGRLRPAANTPEFARYRYWLHAAEGSYMPPLVTALFLNRMETAPMPFFVRPIAKKLTNGLRTAYLNHTTKALFDYLNAEIGKSTWLAGDELSGADIAMSFPMEAAVARLDTASYPNIVDYVARVQARPAYQRGLEKGGEYSLMR